MTAQRAVLRAVPTLIPDRGPLARSALAATVSLGEPARWSLSSRSPERTERIDQFQSPLSERCSSCVPAEPYPPLEQGQIYFSKKGFPKCFWRRTGRCIQESFGKICAVMRGALVWRWAVVFWPALGAVQGYAAELAPIAPLGLRVARGFTVSLYADANLANDIHAMTLDAAGRVVVTGPGYIRTLHDGDGDGRADGFRDFASTQTGGMGLCFNGAELYFVGDGGLWRFVDQNRDGAADGVPEKLLNLNMGEHGAHAIRRGPDGAWYLIGGNDTRFGAQHITAPSPPVQQPEAGALLRLSGSGSEIIAHGFRNPYDFDFNAVGDVFTCDSDVERDFLLPWYTPTRIYHVAYGGHHGWRLSGHARSWNRPGYYVDTVDDLAELGRGSPTGVVCYRHLQFPPYYRNGLFLLDWTFGRVFFVPLQLSGASYRSAPELFLEPIGTHGFAPTDMAVAPDGSLFISIGGRNTRGAVYRVQYAGQPGLAALATNWVNLATSELQTVLESPQPLADWSRAYWVPVASRLGPEPFDAAVADAELPALWRVRAVEVLTELHGGLTTAAALAGARSAASVVRARVAWSLGRIPSDNFGPILLGLARDADGTVRRFALDAILSQADRLPLALVQRALTANLGHPEERVRQAAAQLAARLPEDAWEARWRQTPDARSRLSTILALLWREPQAGVNAEAAEAALEVLERSRNIAHRLEAIRLIILALGDWRLTDASVEVYTAYETAFTLEPGSELTRRIESAAMAVWPSGNAGLEAEAARLLAMVRADAPELPRKVLARIGPGTSAASDFHYLTVLSRLGPDSVTNLTDQAARAILSLEGKLDGPENKQNWPARLGEVVEALLKRDGALAGAMIEEPRFPSPGHAHLARLFGEVDYPKAARRFLGAVEENPRFEWSGDLIDLLSALPAAEVRPHFRKQWNNMALRDELVLQLARRPEEEDREKFVWALTSDRTEVARAGMSALLQLRPKTSDELLVSSMRLLRRLVKEPAEKTARDQLIAVLNRMTGEGFQVEEASAEPAALPDAYGPVFEWFQEKHPYLARNADGAGESEAVWERRLKSVAWEKGDARRGALVFRARGCQTCHEGARALGPDLGGVTARLSPLDLFYTIVFPSRDVALPYRTTRFEMRGGQAYTGTVVFQSADATILQTGAASTVRLSNRDIAGRHPSEVSLMPSGLLGGLSATDLADLYAYMRLLPQANR